MSGTPYILLRPAHLTTYHPVQRHASPWRPSLIPPLQASEDLDKSAACNDQVVAIWATALNAVVLGLVDTASGRPPPPQVNSGTAPAVVHNY